MGKYDKDPLGSRMKANYEDRDRHYLTRRMPVILRIDGKAFHTYCAPLKDRFHAGFIEVMNLTAIALCEHVQGVQFAYIQSDEISILLHDYKTLQTEAWFDYNQSKVESVSAAIAAATFTANSWKIWATEAWNGIDYPSAIHDLKPAYFDSRAFNTPEAEVCNYFVWRQKDAICNSIQSLGQSLFSQKQLHGKSCSELQEMCFQSGHNWNDLDAYKKRGRCVVKQERMHVLDGEVTMRSAWVVDNDIPEFTQDRNYVEKYLAVEED